MSRRSIHLKLDEHVKMVGRAPDANLVLHDRAVSRHHFHVVATEEGARIHVCDGAAPLLHAGREIRQAVVKVGESIVVGDTVLVLTDTPELDDVPPTSSPSPSVHPPPSSTSFGATLPTTTTSVRALLTGVAADVRGLAAVFALDEALSAANDLPAVESAVATWAKTHAECDTVEWIAVTDDQVTSDQELTGAVEAARTPSPPSPPSPFAPFAAGPSPIGGDVLESITADWKAKVAVPLHGPRPGWLAFTTKLSSDRVTDSLRRLFVIAGRICASRLGQLSALLAVKEERESFRRQAVGSAHAFLGESAAAQQLVRMIPRLAASPVTVLLTGETGVGKTFVARLIHESGARKDEPLRIINCASIPENLIESELFGHERGAFTGAVAAQAGAFEAAGRGTLVLDEIGELPLASQAKLLRVLEDKRFERIGSNRSLTLQARIIAATNRDLEAMVTAGTFRSDLFFRISVVKALVPPLRERGSDLAMLAKQMLTDLAPTAARRIDGFSREALDAISRYSWPGNVRELRNAIEHALVLGDGRLIEPTDFPAVVHGVVHDTHSATSEGSDLIRLPANLEWLEQKSIDAALRVAGGNRIRAAALLGIKPAILYYKLRQNAAAPGATDR
ncbi:sigma 54-interacting transcriptional regulator [Pendulispora albinea]|uniref:Sigma 54-interacting transcriptional regulator n=1 Tax=Pendulispora albinea TaxID=2741071 RepID=A0ABZ2M0Z7_9BACT